MNWPKHPIGRLLLTMRIGIGPLLGDIVVSRCDDDFFSFIKKKEKTATPRSDHGAALWHLATSGFLD